MKYGIEGGDRIIRYAPKRRRIPAESRQCRQSGTSPARLSSINLEIHRVNHRDFEGMVVSLRDLIENAEGQVIANLSGGPREIFLAFTIACLAKSEKIFKTTSFSDIERSLNEITLPNIAAELDKKQKRILKDVNENRPTTITEIAERLGLSESTISRQVARLADQKALHLAQKGKIKEVNITLAGKILL